MIGTKKVKLKENHPTKSGGHALFLTSISKFVKPTLDEIKQEMAKRGLPDSEAETFLKHYEANGWRVGNLPMKSFPHAVGNWARNYQEKALGGSAESQSAPSGE